MPQLGNPVISRGTWNARGNVTATRTSTRATGRAAAAEVQAQQEAAAKAAKTNAQGMGGPTTGARDVNDGAGLTPEDWSFGDSNEPSSNGGPVKEGYNEGFDTHYSTDPHTTAMLEWEAKQRRAAAEAQGHR